MTTRSSAQLKKAKRKSKRKKRKDKLDALARMEVSFLLDLVCIAMIRPWEKPPWNKL
jgi:hypothetical protein